MHPGDLESGRDTGCDERCGNEILRDGGVEIECSACDSERWGDDGSDHCESMLETQKEGQKDGYLVVEAVERGFVVFVFAV